MGPLHSGGEYVVVGVLSTKWRCQEEVDVGQDGRILWGGTAC